VFYIPKYGSDARSQLDNEASVTMHYCVRAVAGLLYWFAKECGFLPQCVDQIELQNETLNEGVYLFQAGNHILAGKNVNSSTEGNIELQNFADVRLVSGGD